MKCAPYDYDPGYFSIEPLKNQLTALNLLAPNSPTTTTVAVTTTTITPIPAGRVRQEFEVYYDDANNSYRIRDEHGSWIRVLEPSLRLHAAHHGISSERDRSEELSPCDRWLVDVQKTKSIGYTGPLAGFREGMYKMGGRNVLVTSSPTSIQPVAGEWKTMRSIFEGGLGHDPEQMTCFYGWLKTALEATRHTVLQPGQAMVFCGPRESGKSLLQKIITVLLGGREARPFQFMTGQTPFNSALFGAEHLVIEDEAASTDLRTRRQFGAVLKMVTANETAECHAKFKEAISLSPIRRLTISVNDEPEHLMVLPPLDESLQDKIILFKFEKKPMPVVIKSPTDRENFFEILLGEMPAFVHWLLNWEIPDDWKSPRFGVKHYHHPEIVESIDALAPEARLLSLIDTALFSTKVPLEVEDDTDYWEGEAVELERILTKDGSANSSEAKRLLYYNTACGNYLRRLQKKHPFRISERRNKGRRLWKIQHPDSHPPSI